MKTIGRYEIRRELGRGAMGIVYQADDTALSRQIALKTLWPHLTQDESLVERFRREARAAAGISHPNVVALHDVGDLEDGGNYIVMEHVEGKTLQDVLKGKRVELSEALRWFRQILAGLKAAHLVGVIHRDLKPSNILVRDSDSTIKLVDFGLARFAQDQTMLTHVSEMLGTPEFLAPEIPRGETADARTDLYAAGVIFYRMITGEAPFRGPSLTAVIQAHEQGRYPLAGTIARDLSPQYDIVISQLLAGDRDERYPDADAVLADLARIERGDPIVRIAPRRVAPAVISSSPSSTSAGPVRRIAEWTATWVKFQYLEIFGRTSGTMIVIRGTVEQYEEECAQAHERLQQAVLLRNAIIEELDQLRAASEELASSAERRMFEGDEPAARDILKRKVSLVADRKRLEAEKVEASSLVNQTREDYERISRDLGSLKRRAELLSVRRSRAKRELSIFGRLNGENGRGAERLAAATKLGAVLVILVALTTTGIWASGAIFRNPVEAERPAPPERKKVYGKSVKTPPVVTKEIRVIPAPGYSVRHVATTEELLHDGGFRYVFLDEEGTLYISPWGNKTVARVPGGPLNLDLPGPLGVMGIGRFSDGRYVVARTYNNGSGRGEIGVYLPDGSPQKVVGNDKDCVLDIRVTSGGDVYTMVETIGSGCSVESIRRYRNVDQDEPEISTFRIGAIDHYQLGGIALDSDDNLYTYVLNHGSYGDHEFVTGDVIRIGESGQPEKVLNFFDRTGDPRRDGYEPGVVRNAGLAIDEGVLGQGSGAITYRGDRGEIVRHDFDRNRFSVLASVEMPPDKAVSVGVHMTEGGMYVVAGHEVFLLSRD